MAFPPRPQDQGWAVWGILRSAPHGARGELSNAKGQHHAWPHRPARPPRAHLCASMRRAQAHLRSSCPPRRCPCRRWTPFMEMPAAAPSLLTPCSHHFFFACFSFAAKPAYKRPPSGRTTGRQKRRMASGGAGGRQWAKSASPERSGQGLSRTGACRVRAGLRVVQSVLHVWAAPGARVP